MDGMNMGKDKKKMSIEQAGNYLTEKKETMAADIKAEAKKQAISIASPEDMAKYLMYGISLLNDISETAKNEWCKISNKAPAMYSTHEVCNILRGILVLRANHYSINSIAHKLNVSPVIVVKVEALAIKVVGEAIEKKKNSGALPIIGA